MTALALAPVAVPSIAFATDSHDPIYAAIEAHRDATAAVYSYPGDILDNPEFDALMNKQDDAAVALVGEVPTTTAGVLALLQYVTDYDAQTGSHGPLLKTSHEDWPHDLENEGIPNSLGNPLSMPFHCWLLRNVREALEQIGGTAAAA